MAPTGTPKIDFPERKLRSRSKAKAYDVKTSDRYEQRSSPIRRKLLTPTKLRSCSKKSPKASVVKRSLLANLNASSEKLTNAVSTCPTNLSVQTEWIGAKDDLVGGIQEAKLIVGPFLSDIDMEETRARTRANDLKKSPLKSVDRTQGASPLKRKNLTPTKLSSSPKKSPKTSPVKRSLFASLGPIKFSSPPTDLSVQEECADDGEDDVVCRLEKTKLIEGFPTGDRDSRSRTRNNYAKTSPFTKKHHANGASPMKRKPLTPAKLRSSPRKSPKASPVKGSFMARLDVGPENLNPNSAKKMLQLFHQEASLPKEWSDAKKALSSGQPECGPIGRAKQTKILGDFLTRNLAETRAKRRSSKRSLYVSGPPGTGKTTLLKHLLSSLDGFRTVFVNCMALKSSRSVFASVARGLGCAPACGRDGVEEAIAASKGPILLVLDEIDQLDSRAQEVLYTIYEWPYLAKSKLTIVGIANALDLTDRILPRLRLRKDICPQQLTFPAYSKDEIYKIISSRLEPIVGEVFKPAAVRLLSAKLSAQSGDVRKALDVCRRAMELAEVEARKQTFLKPSSAADHMPFRPIDVPRVLKVINEVYCSAAAATTSLKTTNSDLPTQQKILVASLLLMTSYGARPVKEVTLGKLHETYSRLCRKRGMTPFDFSEVTSLCTMLEARGFFASRSPSQNAKDKRLSLRIDEDEVAFALKDKALLSGILRDLDCIVK